MCAVAAVCAPHNSACLWTEEKQKNDLENVGTVGLLYRARYRLTSAQNASYSMLYGVLLNCKLLVKVKLITMLSVCSDDWWWWDE